MTEAEMVSRVREAGLLTPGRPVLVMFSGGRDSTCLLDLAVRIAGVEAVSAVHVNYGLRGAADADERFCAESCERLGVGLDVRRPVRRGDRTPDGEGAGNLQAWARAERYRAAAELATARDADVAAGHTRSDQVETILYRIASSPSRRALLGMRPITRSHPPLIRPLLPFTREATAAYCAERELPWREDESNESAAFARNRIRRDVVPAFERIHPAAQDNLLALAELLRDEAEVLDGLVDTILDGGSEVEVSRLRELGPALQRLVVQRLADEAIGSPAAGVARRAEDIAALSEEGTASLDLPHGVRATVTAGVLRFGATPPRPPSPDPK